MACDLPSVSYLALYIVSMHIIQSNSRTSTHWKLNPNTGTVQSAVAATGEHDNGMPEDPMMNILTNKVMNNQGEWRLEGDTGCKQGCKPANIEKNNQKLTSSKMTCDSTKKKKKTLSCGKAVNFTKYDHLRGIEQRNNHPHIPEPEVAMIFKKKGSSRSEVDMNELEKKLKKAKLEKPRSPLVLNQIGNFWRIKGNTQLSIECFRKALSLSDDHPDVLLNLARVLFNLQYLDDAIFLTRRSLEMRGHDQNSWLQHFTLGEILKADGHIHEAARHFQLALDLNPGFQPAQAHLREMEISPDGTVTCYTLFIIMFLVLGVLCGILTSIDGHFEEYGETVKTQRHFNRAMAMRSIKLGMNPKLIRMRKQCQY